MWVIIPDYIWIRMTNFMYIRIVLGKPIHPAPLWGWKTFDDVEDEACIGLEVFIPRVKYPVLYLGGAVPT